MCFSIGARPEAGFLLRRLVTAQGASPSLEDTAITFDTSPAALAHHRSHFQAELGQARAHLAVHLFRANFRRGHDAERAARGNGPG